VNPSQQVKAHLEMDPIDFADGLFVVQRSSANSDAGPLLDLDIKYGMLSLIPTFNLTIQGYVNLFDIIEAECDINVK